MKTTALKKNQIEKKWYIIDCTDQIIGRVSTVVAKIIQGKNKKNYAPNLDCGDKVILINTSKLKWTGKKETDKEFIKHTGYQGGLKVKTLGWMMNKNPNRVIEESIYGMLPKTRMRDVYINNLVCYTGEDHKHEAQNPVKYELGKK